MSLINNRLDSNLEYNGRFNDDAESRRRNSTIDLEIYYTARPDGDGFAENEISNEGVSQFPVRRIYYSTKFDANPDVVSDWTLSTTQPTTGMSFEQAKALLLNVLNSQNGKLPLSLKMEHALGLDKLLIDNYEDTSVALSVRKLSNAYSGYCVRVRENAGDTETDIGFDLQGNLDTDAIIAHCSSASGYITTWYDQSGNDANATQTNLSKQPKIYDGQEIIQVNNTPVIGLYTGADFEYTTTVESLNCVCTMATADRSFIFNSSSTSTTRWNMICGHQGNPTQNISRFDDSPHVDVSGYKNGALEAINGVTTRNQMVDFFATGHQIQSLSYWTGFSNCPADTYTLGNRPQSGSRQFGGSLQEFIKFSTDYSDSRLEIEQDINSYYNIYDSDSHTIPRLLNLYPGATAAYGVRKLKSDATDCVRVQRASDGTEQDFGFDSVGIIDMDSIGQFCGYSEGYVAKWYDQSGNQNHAVQSSSGNMPLIYRGGFEDPDVVPTVPTVYPYQGFLRSARAAIEWQEGRPQWLECSGLSLAQPTTVFATCDYNGVLGKNETLFDGSDPINRHTVAHSGSLVDKFTAGADGAIVEASGDTTSLPQLFSVLYNGSNSIMRRVINRNDGGGSVSHFFPSPSANLIGARTVTSGDLGSASWQDVVIGNSYLKNLDSNWDDTITEIVIYNSDQFANVSGIEKNINNYYRIVQS